MRPSVRSLSGAAALCLALAACGTAPVPTSTPSLSPAASSISSTDPLVAPATPSPTVDPSVSVPGDSVPIPPDTYARVITDNLRVRSKPGVSDDSKKLEPLLQKGVQVVVLDGPVQASGYDWYLVQPAGYDAVQVAKYPFGWVAGAGKDGEPWLQPRTPGCPPLPASVEQLVELKETALFAEIACFGDRTFAIQARVGLPEAQCGTEPAWGVDPEWLDSCRSSGAPEFLSVDAPYGNPFRPSWAPGVDTSIARSGVGPPAEWPIVEVKGKFDHPAAQTCRNQLNYEGSDWPEPDPVQTVLACRLQFVVTSMTEVDG